MQFPEVCSKLQIEASINTIAVRAKTIPIIMKDTLLRVLAKGFFVFFKKPKFHILYGRYVTEAITNRRKTNLIKRVMRSEIAIYVQLYHKKENLLNLDILVCSVFYKGLS